jgi:hypothetical protein
MERSADQPVAVWTQRMAQYLAVSSHSSMVSAGNRWGYSLLFYTILPIIILRTLIFQHNHGLKTEFGDFQNESNNRFLSFKYFPNPK